MKYQPDCCRIGKLHMKIHTMIQPDILELLSDLIFIHFLKIFCVTFIKSRGKGSAANKNKWETLVFQNHKFCKIRPKFLPIMHFLQESYEFVQKSQILQQSCKS